MGETSDKQLELLLKELMNLKVELTLQTRRLARARKSAVLSQEVEATLEGATRLWREMETQLEGEIRRLGREPKIDELDLATRIERDWRKSARPKRTNLVPWRPNNDARRPYKLRGR